MNAHPSPINPSTSIHLPSESKHATNMAQTRLDSLPDDLLLDVASELGTARDLSAMSATSRRTHQLLRHDGWRDFVRHGFPNSSSSSIRGKADWMGLADRLTYLDRCWERRAFVLHDFQPEAAKRGNRRRPHTSIGGGQSVSFYPSLDARELTRHAGELAAWGVGEDLVVKLADGRGVPSWSRLEGRAAGYAGGFGDVTAVSVIERHEPEVVVGRANGDIQIVAATGDGFGRVTQTLGTAVQDGGGVTPRRSPGQMAVSWTEWNEGTGMLASGKYSTLTLHNLDIGDDGGEGAVPPASQYDLLDDSPGDELSLVRGVTFLGSDVVACALGGSRRPVRWAKITPTGLEFFDAAANPGPLAYLATQTDVSSDERTTVRAIKPVGHRHNDSLVLTAWDDGTYR